jgi:hypothetical protein
VNPQLDIINCAWTQKNDERRDQPRGEAAKDREPVIDPADQEIPGAQKDQISDAKVGASGRMPGRTSPRFDADDQRRNNAAPIKPFH